ncbi:MAG: hypothetical protein KBA66_20185 [Leptospiraceae bacterium]|nr:hypothetical protein [Leptospiraceae bacterium]
MKCLILFYWLIIIPSLFADTINTQKVNVGIYDNENCPSTEWIEFRKQRTDNYQAITLIRKSDKNTIIISEPPPDVTIENIQDIFERYPKVENQIFMCDDPLGEDGRKRDVILQLYNPLEPEALRNITNDLREKLFGEVFGYSINKVKNSNRYNYDMTFHPHQIIQVINHAFEKKENSQNFNWIDEKEERVLFPKNKEREGIILITFKKNEIIDQQGKKLRKDFRIFSLNTDLIFAAIVTKEKLILVGRKRQIPTQVYPPLRFETFIQLIGIAQKEKENQGGQKSLSSQNDYSKDSSNLLNQSFARKIVENIIEKNEYRLKNKDYPDFAPNLLSNYTLENEIGNALTISDYILKSYSNKGKVKYKNYSMSLPKEFNNSVGIMDYLILLNLFGYQGNGITFNWNTDSHFSKVSIESNELLIPRSTGSLKISFIPDGSKNLNSLKEQEKEYFKLFSTASKSYSLANVVKFVFLREIFKISNIQLKDNLSVPSENLTEKSLEYSAKYGKDSNENAYKEALEKHKEFIKQKNSWLFSPGIIASKYDDGNFITGGHNNDYPVNEFRFVKRKAFDFQISGKKNKKKFQFILSEKYLGKTQYLNDIVKENRKILEATSADEKSEIIGILKEKLDSIPEVKPLFFDDYKNLFKESQKPLPEKVIGAGSSSKEEAINEQREFQNIFQLKESNIDSQQPLPKNNESIQKFEKDDNIEIYFNFEDLAEKKEAA